VYETEVWIRFKAIEDRKVCLFMQGVLVSDKKIKVVFGGGSIKNETIEVRHGCAVFFKG
jgi:hypothetical protein